MTEPPLQPLRIPANWTISYNTFFEIGPSGSVTQYLCEDLLQARCERTDVLVDLGWYPDGDPTGCYVIQVYVGDFSGRMLLRAEAATRFEAVVTLEAALWKYHCIPVSRAQL